MNIWHCFIITCKTYKISIHFFSFKFIKVWVYYCSCYLSCSIWSKIKEYYRIIFFNFCNWFTIWITYYCWYYKFIKYFFLI